MRRRYPFACVSLLSVAACLLASAEPTPGADATAAAEGSTGRYEIGLIGDMPYNALGRAQFPRVIADVNAHPLAFTTFDGDIKSGRERCDRTFYEAARTNFGRFTQPLVYVPGDNEWTDCDRGPGGHYDANERLALVRAMFAGTPRSFGRHTLTLLRQTRYPENIRWRYGAVTYVGLNIPGSDNNAPRYDSRGHLVDGDAAEYAARNEANLDWLDRGFAAARAAGSVAVVVVIQANMWGGTGSGYAHYADTKTELAKLSIRFHGQVLLVNGDGHVLIIDKPLRDAAANVIQNFTRVQTFGNEQNHWLSATVDPADPDVFTFHQHIVRANLPVYVSP